MKSVIRSVVEITANGQILIAITLSSKELIQIIDELDTSEYHKIQIRNRAFKLFGKKTNKVK